MVHAQDHSDTKKKKRAIPLRDSDMWGSQELLVAMFLVLATRLLSMSTGPAHSLCNIRFPEALSWNAACTPAFPHHSQWTPSLKHRPKHLPDCRSPQPWAYSHRAALCLLLWLEEDQWTQ